MKREAGGGLNPVDDSRLRKPHDSSAPEASRWIALWNSSGTHLGGGRLEEEHLVEVEEEHLVEVSGPHNTDCRAGRGQLEPALAHLPPRHLQQLHDTDLVLIRLASTCLFLHEQHGSGKMY